MSSVYIYNQHTGAPPCLKSGWRTAELSGRMGVGTGCPLPLRLSTWEQETCRQFQQVNSRSLWNQRSEAADFITDRPPPDLHQPEKRPLLKVGRTSPPQSTRYRRHFCPRVTKLCNINTTRQLFFSTITNNDLVIGKCIQDCDKIASANFLSYNISGGCKTVQSAYLDKRRIWFALIKRVHCTAGLHGSTGHLDKMPQGENNWHQPYQPQRAATYQN